MTPTRIIGMLAALFIFSCLQQAARNEIPIDFGEQQLKADTAVSIENGINRGTNYTDDLEMDYSLRYIPVTIKNDTTLPLEIHLDFSKEFSYPPPHGNEKFSLLPLPEEWALDGIGITESMIAEIPEFINNPLLYKTLKSGEKYKFAIGSLYPRPTQLSGVLPRALFIVGENSQFQECGWTMKIDPEPEGTEQLGLKILLSDTCLIIPCGTISYSEN